MTIGSMISDLWNRFQGCLFPELEEEVGPLYQNHQKLVRVLDVAPPEAFIPSLAGLPGRPQSDRLALARAFIAKSIWDLPTTRHLIDRIQVDATLRRLCGWPTVRSVPSEATFSRAFAEFAERDLPGQMHARLVENALGDTIIGHVSRDSTAIEAREKPAPKPKKEEKPAPRKRGRPRKGEERPPKEPLRVERQLKQSTEDDPPIAAMIADLPTKCDVGTKQNAKGYKESWIGYKLHIDASDGGIPISCLLSSASLHDSQVAIPLSCLSGERLHHFCYELMDSAYDSEEIGVHSYLNGRVPIIDINPRRDKELKEDLAREARAQRKAGIRDHVQVRYNERSTVERVNSRLKDHYGGRHVRVRGPTKVFCHLMFGILALTVEQILRLTR